MRAAIYLGVGLALYLLALSGPLDPLWLAAFMTAWPVLILLWLMKWGLIFFAVFAACVGLMLVWEFIRD